ncbi:MAG: class I SAM-dependent methyltransferase [Candidatus Sulfotelmatobacter sp.]
MLDVKQGIKKALGHFGYKICRIDAAPNTLLTEAGQQSLTAVDPLAPIWPLPRGNADMSAEQIRGGFAKHDAWHYAYEFEGGLSFPVRGSPGGAIRPLQRFRHFMPYLLRAQGGSLRGKRVLDIACNSGFWSIQCALLGAEVVGFDARPELVEQANFIKSVVGLKNVEFRLLDFWEMESLGTKFDVVLNLGILYHLPEPLEALKLTAAMARQHILLDTEVYRSAEAAVQLRWEEPLYIRSANRSGIVAIPSRRCVDLMLRDIGAVEWFEIPLRSSDMPPDYREHWRASWLITV